MDDWNVQEMIDGAAVMVAAVFGWVMARAKWVADLWEKADTTPKKMGLLVAGLLVFLAVITLLQALLG